METKKVSTFSLLVLCVLVVVYTSDARIPLPTDSSPSPLLPPSPPPPISSPPPPPPPPISSPPPPPPYSPPPYVDCLEPIIGFAPCMVKVYHLLFVDQYCCDVFRKCEICMYFIPQLVLPLFAKEACGF
ncbi:hypothetical protein M5689_001058 [Euphorbia peplus]|nr:hypothetical protein M5689_001058 [Euphorbia peplus]